MFGFLKKKLSEVVDKISGKVDDSQIPVEGQTREFESPRRESFEERRGEDKQRPSFLMEHGPIAEKQEPVAQESKEPENLQAAQDHVVGEERPGPMEISLEDRAGDRGARVAAAHPDRACVVRRARGQLHAALHRFAGLRAQSSDHLHRALPRPARRHPNRRHR